MCVGEVLELWDVLVSTAAVLQQAGAQVVLASAVLGVEPTPPLAVSVAAGMAVVVAVADTAVEVQAQEVAAAGTVAA